MAIVVPKPFIMGNALVKIGADQHELAVNSVEFKPTPITAIYRGLTPAARYPVSGGSDWAVDIGYAQDWNTTGALSRYLLTAEGTTVAMEFTPVAGGPKVTANVTIVPGSIGGAGSAVATGSVSLPCDKPVLGAVI
jgi:hypothetical protein